MEKTVRRDKLSSVFALMKTGRVQMTAAAPQGAAEVGLAFAAMLAIAMALTKDDFHKRMATRANQRRGQDAYRPVTPYGTLYLKLTAIDEVLIVSFKRRQPCYAQSAAQEH